MPELENLVREQFGRLAGADLPIPPAEAVVKRGRQRRRRARGRAMAIAAAVAAITAIAVSQLAASPAVRRPAPTGHAHHRSPVSHALACPAAPSTSLTDELTTPELPVSAQLNVRPIAMSADGTALYLLTTTQGFHGIAEENVQTGAILARIASLPLGYTSAQGGLGPGGVLVWTSTYNTHDLFGAMTAVRMWSARTGNVTTLEPAGQHGAALSSPVFFGSGNWLAAWEVADGQRQEIVEANLLTGVTDIVASGYLGPPVFVGNALVWSASREPGGHQTHLVAVNAANKPSRHPIAVPVSLRGASEAVVTRFGGTGAWQPASSLIASYRGAVVYLSAGLTRLYYSPFAYRPARLVVKLTGGDSFSPGGLFLGPGYIGWGTAYARSYLASTASFAVAEVINGTTRWGGLNGLGSDILAGIFAPTKKQHLTQVHVVSGSTISALRCAGQ